MESEAEQREDFEAQSAALNEDTLKKWEKIVTDWEKDPSLPDPYLNEHTGMCVILSLSYRRNRSDSLP